MHIRHLEGLDFSKTSVNHPTDQKYSKPIKRAKFTTTILNVPIINKQRNPNLENVVVIMFGQNWENVIPRYAQSLVELLGKHFP